MIDLVSGAIDPTSDTGKEIAPYLQLAERQKARLKAQVSTLVGEQIIFLRKRVEAAKMIGATDQQRARAICQSVVELFGDKRWAQSVVHRAADLLATLPPSTQPATTQPGGGAEAAPEAPAQGAPAAE
ncbi:MAG: hypothetical protein NTW19_10330 [Planctomycetota bacterium]|nr:hypothetical protein [Planctomycetota bacterium]